MSLLLLFQCSSSLNQTVLFRRPFSSGSKMSDEFCIQHPTWNKTVQFSLPLVKRSHLPLRHQHSGASETTYFALNIEFSLFCLQLNSRFSTLQHIFVSSLLIFNIYLFQPNTCFFPPKDKMNVTNVNKHCQPHWNMAFIISKLNVPSLQNSHRGCKTNVSVCKLWSLTSSKKTDVA